MRQAYLFVFNDQVGTQDQVKDLLNRMRTVADWRFDMPSVFYILSDYSADQIAKEFENLAGTNGRFIFLEYTGNSQGRLTSESWFLLNNKRREQNKK